MTLRTPRLLTATLLILVLSVGCGPPETEPSSLTTIAPWPLDVDSDAEISPSIEAGMKADEYEHHQRGSEKLLLDRDDEFAEPSEDPEPM